ncbi:GNAT family N-acetyltransferase [Pimelobacter simplex]|uniref:GNAT family N-acetyltransferase n=1 Tax=Nocardioides simplex TaxID=2045 RepID=A0A7J5E1Q1_NOCSI|nr:GNAT family N-acetyltransferase [Pimelobacter simplex]
MTSRYEVAATPRLRITTWLASDVDDLAALHGDPAVMVHLSPGGTKWRVEDRSGRMVGRAGFGAHGAGRELGYTLGRDVWGRGLASELAVALVAWHHAHPLPEPAVLLAFATPDNAASRRVPRPRVGVAQRGSVSASSTCRSASEPTRRAAGGASTRTTRAAPYLSRSAVTSATKSVAGSRPSGPPSRSATTDVGSTTGEQTATRPSRSTLAPRLSPSSDAACASLTVSVTGRTPTTTTSATSARSAHARRKSGGVIGHSGSCRSSGPPRSTSASQGTVWSSRSTPASPAAQAAAATRDSPWIRRNGSAPRPSSTTIPATGAEMSTTSYGCGFIEPTV